MPHDGSDPDPGTEPDVANRRRAHRDRGGRLGLGFSPVDHFDVCCVGIHTAKIRNRFAALQPIAQGLYGEFAATGADAGRGLRMNHGTQYAADDFVNQIRFWGIETSFAFVCEPQTNGVVERFNPTLKEQSIHGRIFRSLEEVRAVVTEFRDRYNRHWRLEKRRGLGQPLEVGSLMRSATPRELQILIQSAAGRTLIAFMLYLLTGALQMISRCQSIIFRAI